MMSYLDNPDSTLVFMSVSTLTCVAATRMLIFLDFELSMLQILCRDSNVSAVLT